MLISRTNIVVATKIHTTMNFLVHVPIRAPLTMLTGTIIKRHVDGTVPCISISLKGVAEDNLSVAVVSKLVKEGRLIENTMVEELATSLNP